jgi:CubicO group peptidase (beta-lactamase class C family)
MYVMKGGVKYIVGFVFLCFFLLWDIINTGGVGSHSDYSFVEESAYDPSRLYNRLSDNESFNSFDYSVNRFLRKWHIKGASVAVLKDEKLVYAKGYGYADEEAGIMVEPFHTFRIASVSKLVTAVAIMNLVEDAKLSLNDKVFGIDGILKDSIYSNYVDKRYEQITLHHLLMHRAGWTTRWGDHMFIPHSIAKQMKRELPIDDKTYIEFALSKRLHFTPGRYYSYSNLGYVILGKVIEEVTGKTYENYVQNEILYPIGIYDMQIGQNLFKDKALFEVKYYEQHDAFKAYSIYDKNKKVSKSYGGNDITALNAAGGWIASAPSLAKLLTAINGESYFPDVLLPESIELMTKPMHKGDLPLGWKGAYHNTWWRSGTLAGTSAFVYKGSGDISYVFITNTSNWKGSDFTIEINKMMHRALSKIKKWPSNDLFLHREMNPVAINFTDIY